MRRPLPRPPLPPRTPAENAAACYALTREDRLGPAHAKRVVENFLAYPPSTRAAAMNSLGLLDDKGMTYAGAVAQRLADEDEAVYIKAVAIEALGNMREHGAAYAAVVAEYLQDPMPFMRAAAATSLGKMGGGAEAYLGSLRSLGSDPDAAVQSRAASTA